MRLDARGLVCPQPVILAKKQLDGGCRELTVAVDNAAAVENLTRLGASMGLCVESGQSGGAFEVRFHQADCAIVEAEPNCRAPVGSDYVVFIGKESVGAGDETLGYNLMKMALYTLAQGESLPTHVLFINGGVRLPAGGERQIIESLNTLIDRGVSVLACGTCLDFYGLSGRLQVGRVSNMYEILDVMQAAGKVIAL